MSLLRIRDVAPLEGFRLRLTLTDGRVIERDVSSLLAGPIFDRIRGDRNLFCQVRAEAGTVVWPNGADLCPDVLIWGGPPPEEASFRIPQSTRSCLAEELTSHEILHVCPLARETEYRAWLIGLDTPILDVLPAETFTRLLF